MGFLKDIYVECDSAICSIIDLHVSGSPLFFVFGIKDFFKDLFHNFYDLL